MKEDSRKGFLQREGIWGIRGGREGKRKRGQVEEKKKRKKEKKKLEVRKWRASRVGVVTVRGVPYVYFRVGRTVLDLSKPTLTRRRFS